MINFKGQKLRITLIKNYKGGQYYSNTESVAVDLKVTCLQIPPNIKNGLNRQLQSYTFIGNTTTQEQGIVKYQIIYYKLERQAVYLGNTASVVLGLKLSVIDSPHI